MIKALLDATGGWMLIPIVVAVAGTAVAKGLFGVYRSKSQDRKDFLDLWERRESPDDLWLEVAVRHQFGAYLPAPLIRSLQRSSQAGRALLEVSECWDMLDMDDETGEVHWRAKRYANPRHRWWMQKVFTAGYYVLMFAAGILAIVLIKSTGRTDFSYAILWAYPLFLGGAAFCCLSRSERLETASKAVPRWLGLR
ncbi:hypothetical protein ACFQZQ_04320 [Lysobacter koreensis]|uniref:TIGR04222 domain-containing membrane protein n=1 Tax=Lysobacter koreensis TaxID=266122 RepID=A0ABW2YK79_9GAMM